MTPVYSSETIGRWAGRPVFLKAENLQRTGSFKIRGAANKIATLSDEERARGVVAASAGNHAQGVAWAARDAGIPATIFMPEDTPLAKVDAVRSYGAEVVLTGRDYEAAQAACRERAETGAALIHPFDDDAVIAGQGTIGLEIGEQLPELETVLVGVGGGGLASGVALALKEVRPEIRVVGVHVDSFAWLLGDVAGGYTIAEGIAVKEPVERTTAILRERLDDVVTVTDEEIARTIVVLLERAKLVVEGAGAAPVAALLAGKVGGTGPACALLSGGNIDASVLMDVVRYALTQSGRFLVLRTRVSDRPGALAKLLALLAAERVNVLAVEHHREGLDLPVGESELELTLGTRDEAHCAELLAHMADWGYAVERLR